MNTPEFYVQPWQSKRLIRDVNNPDILLRLGLGGGGDKWKWIEYIWEREKVNTNGRDLTDYLRQFPDLPLDESARQIVESDQDFLSTWSGWWSTLVTGSENR